MQYDVTIGIPVYRAKGYIDKTMASALAQSFPSIEFLVLDDCGNDGSMVVVERLQKDHPRGNDIRIIRNERNCGIGIARNRILDEAKGRYLYFLDSDDLIDPNTIQCLVEKAIAYHTDVVYGSLERIDLVNNMPAHSYVLPDICLLSDDDMALYAFKNYSTFQISICNCLMSLEFVRDNQLRFINSMFWEDLAFTYEMVTKVSRAVLVSKVTYHYLCRPGSLSHYQDREIFNKSEILENVSVMDYLKDKSRKLIGKSYLPYYCYDLEMNCFYIVCYVLKQFQRIVPSISNKEMQGILSHPLGMGEIFRFRHKLVQNLFFAILSHLPASLSIFIVRLLDRIKKSI